MEFKVIFYSLNGKPVDIEEKELGIDGLDEMRQKFDIFGIGIPSEKINGIVPELKKVRIKGVLSENEARKSGYFQGENNVYVEVPEGSLNQYTTRIIDIDLDDEEEIKCINIIHDIDIEKIINNWKNAGYPIGWR